MSVINERFPINQLKCDNKKFVTILPKYQYDDEEDSYEIEGQLCMFCVTNDDNVFAYQCIDGEFIGDVNKNSLSEPIKVEELCQKQVIDIMSGADFTIALTKCGRVYSWGENDCGQLGHGNTINEYLKPTIISSLIDKSIVDIKCGKHHSLALTRNGEVFEWGWNAVMREDMTAPVQVIGLKFHTIISISCGCVHSLALTDNRDVFSWGWNGNGQLGIGNTTNQCNPCKVDNLNDDKIVKISCAAFHSMLLSENGDIYVFGDNEFGQIGDGTHDNKNIPIKLNIDTKFVDITSSGNYNEVISTGLSVNGFCYVWGECDERVITTPTKSKFTSIDEVMLTYTPFKVTYKPYYYKKTYENMTPQERFKETFNKSELKVNDITFKIDCKSIYVQKTYLISVCQHFDTLFSNEWIESTNSVIEITQYSHSVYYAFLKYLYTTSLELKSKDLVALYHLSDSYFEENLKKKCIKMINGVINVNNVIDFYAFSVKNNFSEIENYTFAYMKDRIKDVSLMKSESYIEMNDTSILKKLFETCCTFQV